MPQATQHQESAPSKVLICGCASDKPCFDHSVDAAKDDVLSRLAGELEAIDQRNGVVHDYSGLRGQGTAWEMEVA